MMGGIQIDLNFGSNGPELILSENNSFNRKFKGKNLLAFPSNYTLIDIETTGLDPQYDSIIEISAIEIINNEPVESFTSLIYCEEHIDEFVTEMTGITNDMLSEAPRIQYVLPRFKDFISDSILVGHNINFDINFLYDNFEDILGEPLTNNFIDTMRLSRRILPELRHHRLKDIANHYKISLEGLHRALNDCKITNECFTNIKKDVINQFDSIETFIKITKTKLNAKNITTSNTEFDVTHPLYGKECVFTGVLQKMLRKDAMQIVVDFGGICGNTVTSKTNFLILGNNDYCPTIKGGKSSKHKKAEQFKLNGNDIEIISESVFYDIINQNVE